MNRYRGCTAKTSHSASADTPHVVTDFSTGAGVPSCMQARAKSHAHSARSARSVRKGACRKE